MCLQCCRRRRAKPGNISRTQDSPPSTRQDDAGQQMKTMKPILKLLFVALLISWAFSRPPAVSAQGQNYTCSEPGMYNCTLSASEWMGQCIAECPKQGSDEEFDYNYLVCNGGVCDMFEEYYYAPMSGANCYDECDNVMGGLINGCLSSNCTPE